MELRRFKSHKCIARLFPRTRTVLSGHSPPSLARIRDSPFDSYIAQIERKNRNILATRDIRSRIHWIVNGKEPDIAKQRLQNTDYKHDRQHNFPPFLSTLILSELHRAASTSVSDITWSIKIETSRKECTLERSKPFPGWYDKVSSK